MSKRKYVIVLAILSLALSDHVTGQGCSDAGFCTLNSFKPNTGDSAKQEKNQIKTGVAFGSADNAIFILGNYLEYNKQLHSQFGIDCKITTLSQKGNGISAFGLSDIFLNANYKANERLRLTLGAKIPLSKSDRRLDNLPLPMDYQASLGTFDLLAGIGYEFHKIQFVAALQQPLTQNDNQFIASGYPDGSRLRAFQSTNKFKRSGDVLLRVSYPVSLGGKLKLTPSILPIYHLANDKYTDTLQIEREIFGSEGLTLNGNLYLDYEITEKHALQLNVGRPYIVRESRPDGLTRSLIANLEYRMKF